MDKERNRYVPDTVSPPGETLQETLDTLGMSQAELAERTGRPKKTINEIVKGKTAITPETALQLERALGVPASFWNARERAYQEFRARLDEHTLLESRATEAWLEKFPVAQMVKFGWLAPKSNRIERARELLNFFGVATPAAWNDQWASVCAEFRKSQTHPVDFGALTAWLRRGELVARDIASEPFDRERFRTALVAIRNLTVHPPPVFQPQMQSQCASAGVVFVLVPELPRLRVSGATRWLTPMRALVQMSLRFKSDDHFWFTFFHESGHVLAQRKKETFIDNDATNADEEAEAAANRFAGDFLIPRDDYTAFVSAAHFSKQAIRDFAQRIGIAPGVVVGRLQFERRLPFSHCNDLKRRFEWSAAGEN